MGPLDWKFTDLSNKTCNQVLLPIFLKQLTHWWKNPNENHTSYISKTNMGEISSLVASILMAKTSAIEIIFKSTCPIRVTANSLGLFLAEFLAG